MAQVETPFYLNSPICQESLILGPGFGDFLLMMHRYYPSFSFLGSLQWLPIANFLSLEGDFATQNLSHPPVDRFLVRRCLLLAREH